MVVYSNKNQEKNQNLENFDYVIKEKSEGEHKQNNQNIRNVE